VRHACKYRSKPQRPYLVVASRRVELGGAHVGCLLDAMKTLSAILAVTSFLAFANLKLLAQTPPPAPKNLVANGGFENSVRRENLWYGVDSAGYLAGERGQMPVLTLGGEIADTAMPISVGVADMNGDGLPDILTMDVLGYLRIYFNSGSKEEPRFTVGELAGIFLTRTAPKDPTIGREFPNARLAPRLCAADMTKSGKKDLIVGNYLGEVFLVPNGGSATSPDFRQPPNLSQLVIPTMKNPNKRWGNVFAPFVWDWNKDGKNDLLLGEGSYSANNIHLLINQGSGTRPVFDENNRFVLAYGDGLEHLTPSVVDYNGDGAPDLLVAERSGKIAVYLNTGEAMKPGAPPPEIPFTSFIVGADGRPMSFGGICTIATGDLNGDGLFDLVVGKTNGRIAVAMNIGTKTKPKFAVPVELKGTAGTPPFAMPSGWEIDYGVNRGNFFGFISTVKGAEDSSAQATEGEACLKVGYVPSQNKIMPLPSVYTPAFPGFEIKGPDANLTYGPARYFMLRQSGRFRFQQDTSYILTFKVKGRITDGQCFVAWRGFKKLSDEKIVQGERGSAG
jgi:VCBS repeat protein